MNITLQCVIETPPVSHDASYKLGDIVKVYRTSDLSESPSPNSRLGFIHITDVPITAVSQIDFLMNSETSDSVDGNGNPIIVWIYRRKWSVPPLLIPPVLRQDLIDNRQIIVTWTQAKTAVYNRVEDRLIIDTDVA